MYHFLDKTMVYVISLISFLWLCAKKESLINNSDLTEGFRMAFWSPLAWAEACPQTWDAAGSTCGLYKHVKGMAEGGSYMNQDARPWRMSEEKVSTE